VILGIMSDNHGRQDPVRRAIGLFEARQVEGIVHCGDLGGLETVELIAQRRCWFVWGNVDCPDPDWRVRVEQLGAPWPEQVPVVIPAGDKTIAVCHGHESVFHGVCRSGHYDYVLHGHTHERSDRHLGRTRVVNSGALHRVTTRTVAILDTLCDEVTFLELKRGTAT